MNNKMNFSENWALTEVLMTISIIINLVILIITIKRILFEKSYYSDIDKYLSKIYEIERSNK